MDEQQLPKAIQEKIFEYEELFDKWIENGKRFCAENNIKSYVNFPVLKSGQRTFADSGIENLQDLIENKEEIVRAKAYAYIQSRYFSDDLKALKEKESEILKKNVGILVGVGLGGLAIGAFWNWWIALAVFIVGGGLAWKFAFAKSAPERKNIVALIEEKQAAVEYVKQAVEKLSFSAQKRVQIVQASLNVTYAETQRLKRDIARLTQEIATMGRTRVTNSSTSSQNANADSTYSSGGRQEIVDDAGRRQGYVEDGRIYDDKSDVVGYVDSDRRVYDADYRRVGEVGKDGKIEKYR